MNIACCGVSRELFYAIERDWEGDALYFPDQTDRRGDVSIAYALQDGMPIRLTVVGYQGAAGLTACDFLRSRTLASEVLWLCRRPEFAGEAKRLGVHFRCIGSDEENEWEPIRQEIIRLTRQQPQRIKEG